MKNQLLTFIGAMFLAFQGFSQNELSLNVSSLLFNEAAITYESRITSHLSYGAFASYNFDLPPTENNQFINRNINFGPEIKYYVNPNKGFDGFFMGLYLKESIGNIALNDEYYYWGDEPNLTSESSKFNKLAFGFQLGAKWVTSNNVLLGMYFGVGRNIFNHYENTEIRDYYFDNVGAAEDFDFRFGFNLGYRFR